MFKYLIESDVRRPRPDWSLLVSTFVNLSIISGGVAATDRAAGEPLVTERQTRVQYFLPPLPVREHIVLVGLAWATGTAPGVGDLPAKGDGPLQAGSRELGVGEGRKGEAEQQPAVTEATGIEYGVGSPVYAQEEVERAAERDASSAAPAYPKSLQDKGIEGSVGVEFVVDTTGRADPASLKVLEATHPAFIESVKEALPHMVFRPAEMGNVKVRQLVGQRFKFVLDVKARETLAEAAKKPQS